MIVPASSRGYRALIIGDNALDDQLRGILSGYGYFVEHCRNRLDGIRTFRAQRQSLVILDIRAIRRFPARLLRFFRLVRENAIILVVAGPGQSSEAARYLLWGAHDVLHMPLKREAFNFTLSRTSAYHRALVRTTFLRYALYFGGAMLPLWAVLIYLVLR